MCAAGRFSHLRRETMARAATAISMFLCRAALPRGGRALARLPHNHRRLSGRDTAVAARYSRSPPGARPRLCFVSSVRALVTGPDASGFCDALVRVLVVDTFHLKLMLSEYELIFSGALKVSVASGTCRAFETHLWPKCVTFVGRHPRTCDTCLRAHACVAHCVQACTGAVCRLRAETNLMWRDCFVLSFAKLAPCAERLVCAIYREKHCTGACVDKPLPGNERGTWELGH